MEKESKKMQGTYLIFNTTQHEYFLPHFVRVGDLTTSQPPSRRMNSIILKSSSEKTSGWNCLKFLGTLGHRISFPSAISFTWHPGLHLLSLSTTDSQLVKEEESCQPVDCYVWHVEVCIIFLYVSQHNQPQSLLQDKNLDWKEIKCRAVQPRCFFFLHIFMSPVLQSFLSLTWMTKNKCRMNDESLLVFLRHDEWTTHYTRHYKYKPHNECGRIRASAWSPVGHFSFVSLSTPTMGVASSTSSISLFYIDGFYYCSRDARGRVDLRLIESQHFLSSAPQSGGNAVHEFFGWVVLFV